MMKLTKHHGLGNDFLIALASNNPSLRPDPELAVRLCHRNFGIGADGLIFLMPTTDAATIGEMVLINSDGSPSEISGNGIRCLGQAILMSPNAPTTDDPLVIATSAGRRTLRYVSGTPRSELHLAVSMGKVTPGPELTQAALRVPGLRHISLNTGNPHVVIHMDPTTPVSADQLDDYGAAICDSVEEGTNVHVITSVQPVDKGDIERIQLMVWERGAGRTMACGSGATAAAFAAHNWGLTNEVVAVEMAGGSVTVDVSSHDALLTGPTEFIAEVIVDD